jgi:hypothetical protein
LILKGLCGSERRFACAVGTTDQNQPRRGETVRSI